MVGTKGILVMPSICKTKRTKITQTQYISNESESIGYNISFFSSNSKQYKSFKFLNKPRI